LEDLDSFVSEASDVREGTDLVQLAQRVTHEFVRDQGVGVRLALSDGSVRASVSPNALMDALYLVLHNASRFGRGQTIDLTVAQQGARAALRVRDHGPGFSEEAFRRAFDPFYSTSEDGLGLGLPHARKLLEAMGGSIQLRNVPDGGAEVEISLPTS
jgi:signal transduction histidine kinase